MCQTAQSQQVDQDLKCMLFLVYQTPNQHMEETCLFWTETIYKTASTKNRFSWQVTLNLKIYEVIKWRTFEVNNGMPNINNLQNNDWTREIRRCIVSLWQLITSKQLWQLTGAFWAILHTLYKFYPCWTSCFAEDNSMLRHMSPVTPGKTTNAETYPSATGKQGLSYHFPSNCSD